MTTAPSMPASFMCCTTLRCSSEVPGGASMIRKSRSAHSVSFKNCFISPSFLGPRQITASSAFGNKNPIDINDRLSVTKTGDQPLLDLCTSFPSWPKSMGADGPHISISRRPTQFFLDERAYASCAAKVLLPTPPFPDRMRTLCFTAARRSRMATTSGCTPFGVAAQALWFGHPEQAGAVPAALAFVPGQLTLASSGTTCCSMEGFIRLR
mmetsp:Transcript_1738/g.7763  ORF Transcript_1738/g.7763 Transcript_1738/m.7763 type:complete len:210 (+) Transcript_1738:1123-1752(+)